MNEKYFRINSSGVSISCKLYYNDLKNLRKAVIFGHGFGGHKDNKAAEKFAKRRLDKHKDSAVITFNLPCHGDDVKKSLSLSDCDLYIGLAVDYVKQRYKPEQLFCYATSFGGYLFLKYISEHSNPFDKLALRCPAVNMSEVLLNTIMKENEQKAILSGKPALVGFDRKIKVTKALLDELEAADITVRDYSAEAEKILIMHGTKDEVVPFEASKAFAEKNGIEFIAIENADHRFIDPLKMDAAIKAIEEHFN